MLPSKLAMQLKLLFHMRAKLFTFSIIYCNISKAMFLKWFPGNNQYGTCLVPGLLKLIAAVTQATETELVETGVSFAVLP
jgi:hypothetical protein